MSSSNDEEPTSPQGVDAKAEAGCPVAHDSAAADAVRGLDSIVTVLGSVSAGLAVIGAIVGVSFLDETDSQPPPPAQRPPPTRESG